MYPRLNEQDRTRSLTDVWRGYDHARRAADGTWYDEQNISSALFPIMTTRAGRAIFKANAGTVTKPDHDMTDVTGMTFTDDGISDGAIIYTRGKKLYYQYVRNGEPGNTFWWDLDLNEKKKQIIVMGSYIVIFPDKKYANKNSFRSMLPEVQEDYGDMECMFDAAYATASFVNAEGEKYAETIPAQKTAPEDAKDGDYWIDTSGEEHHLKLWSEANGYWTTIETTYIKVMQTGIGASFREGDGVEIVNDNLPDTIKLPESAVIKKRGDDFIIIPGIIKTEGSVSCCIYRNVPDMDYVTIAGNRIWGCRFRYQSDKIINEIYASKLGDFKNWNVFEGLSTDSYAATIGKDGDWTGAVTYNGYPCFFKEDALFRVYISASGAHQIQENSMAGIEKGSDESAVIIRQTLYYKSPEGVMAYDGSLPVKISNQLGEVKYKNAVAGEIGGIYYISMEDAESEHHLFTYDTGNGIWNREDNTFAEHFVRAGSVLIAKIGSELVCLQGADSEETIEWYAESAVMGTSDPDAKYLKRIDIMMALEDASSIKIEAEYDQEGTWHELASLQYKRPGAFTIPVRPRRCKLMRIRFSGVGKFRLYSISKVMEAGSER